MHREMADPRLTLSEIESMRFGIPVFRLILQDAPAVHSDLRNALNTLPKNGLLILTLVDCDLDCAIDIGLEFKRRIFTGTPSVDWVWTPHGKSSASAGFPADEVMEQLERRVAAREVPRLVRLSFAGYHNHHWEDPLLRPHLDLGAAYAEWATTMLKDGQANSFVLRKQSEVMSFLVDQPLPDQGLRILLAATLPGHQSQGFYTHMLQKYLETATGENIQFVHISTQVNNIRVQRRWAALGFLPNSLLRHLHFWPVGSV